MSEKKQYFYLVAIQRGESDTNVVPNKITLQEYEAVKYGRRLATQLERDAQDGVIGGNVRLYRQPITRNGNIEFIRTLDPYQDNGERSFKVNHDKSEKLSYFLIHWLSEGPGNPPTLIKGRDELDAVRNSGYGAGAMAAVNWIQKLHDDQVLITPCDREFIITKNVGGLIVPNKVPDKYQWYTGITFMDGTDVREYYVKEEFARDDYEFLKSKLFPK